MPPAKPVKAVAKGENPLVRWFKDTRAELRKVVWPTRQETIRLTGVVIGLSVLVGGILGLADYVFLSLYRLIAP
jgi:preprotein translocase subunit SecE